VSHAIPMHPPWCAEDCTAAVTGAHISRPVAVAPEASEFVGMTVALEQLVETPPITLVVLTFTQDGEAIEYRLRVGQVRALQYALRGALRRLATA
jgi:hypothetical protein